MCLGIFIKIECVLLSSSLSNEELEHYMNDEDAVVQIDQYISRLDVVSCIMDIWLVAKPFTQNVVEQC